MSFSVYLLYDPDDPGVGYIGQTKNDLPTRINAHMNWATFGRPGVQSWLQHRRQVVGRGYKPHFRILCACETREEARQREKEYITRYRLEQTDMRLLNIVYYTPPSPSISPKPLPRAEYLALAREGRAPWHERLRSEGRWPKKRGGKRG